MGLLLKIVFIYVFVLCCDHFARFAIVAVSWAATTVGSGDLSPLTAVKVNFLVGASLADVAFNVEELAVKEVFTFHLLEALVAVQNFTFVAVLDRSYRDVATTGA